MDLQPQHFEPNGLTPKIKPVERDCPRCDAILVFNETEECFECLNCGYIDCAND